MLPCILMNQVNRIDSEASTINIIHACKNIFRLGTPFPFCMVPLPNFPNHCVHFTEQGCDSTEQAYYWGSARKGFETKTDYSVTCSHETPTHFN